MYFGIDLGTTNSCAAVFKNGRMEIVPNSEGNRVTPSIVCYRDSSERLVGDAAKAVSHKYPTATIFDAKRLIGMKYEDDSVQKDMSRWPFRVVPDKKTGGAKIQVAAAGGKKNYSPEQVSAVVLEYLKTCTEEYTGCEAAGAVITVPAHFTDAQRKSTQDAAAIAKLKVLRIINEPTAAAIAYGLDKQAAQSVNILIFDLGGGTFDVSIVTCRGSVIEVLATGGDAHLGGEDFDNRLLHFIIECVKQKLDMDVSGDPRNLRRLRTECEKAKRALSSASSADVECELNGREFSATITRANFDRLMDDLFKLCLSKVEETLKDANMDKDTVDEILLVGGSSRVPKMQDMLKKFFVGKSLSKAVNGDEAVAIGAGLLAHSLSDGSDVANQMVLMDVCALSLGIEVDKGVFVPIVERNSRIPIKVTRDRFTTTFTNQDAVEIPIYEGERPIAKDNNLLGKLVLLDIPPATAGVPNLEITFSVNMNGCLDIEAKEKKSGKSNRITVNNGGLTKEDIERMISEAEEHKVEDEKKKEKILTMSQFDAYIESAVKNLKYYDKLELMQQKIDEHRVWLSTQAINLDVEEIKSKLTSFRNDVQGVLDACYCDGQMDIGEVGEADELDKSD